MQIIDLSDQVFFWEMQLDSEIFYLAGLPMSFTLWRFRIE